MAAREFPIQSRDLFGTRRNVHQIFCSECDESAYIICNTNAGAYPAEFLSRQFKNKGWDVGKKTGHDTCPKCLAEKRTARRAKAKSGHLTVVQPPLIEVPVEDKKPTLHLFEKTSQAADAPLRADPPPVMTKEDKRLVYGKINEVYIDEFRGYDTGWNDERVARDMGVPRAWVAQVRDEMFGAEEGNGDIQRLEAEIAELRPMIAALHERFDEMKAALAAIKTSHRQRGAA